MAQDGILPKRFARLSDKQIPVNAILLAVVVSLPIPFLGRTTIGWIVDATTMGAVILYGFVSLAVMLVNYRSMQKWERKALEERDEAHTIAFTDPMTGVKSKHAFLLDQEEIDTTIDEGAAGEFAIAVCDVNGLKVINDTLGHKAGDEFVAILRGRDYLARKELLQELHDRSVKHIDSKDVVVSGGLANYRPGDDASFHDVFERADVRMYKEKELLKSMGSITREDAEGEKNPG